MFSPEIFSSFIGTLLALLSAGLVWMLKTAYTKHGNEMAALARFERMYAKNLTLVRDNFEQIQNWISACSQQRPFSFHFEPFLFDDEESFKLKNLFLINAVIQTNYILKNVSQTIENIYKTHWEATREINHVTDVVQKEKDYAFHCKTIKTTLEHISENQKTLNSNIINSLATLRTVHKVRRHSFFGYVDLLFVDIFPQVTQETIKRERLKVEENIKQKTLSQDATYS